jgi:hypothetical protein
MKLFQVLFSVSEKLTVTLILNIFIVRTLKMRYFCLAYLKLVVKILGIFYSNSNSCECKVEFK